MSEQQTLQTVTRHLNDFTAELAITVQPTLQFATKAMVEFNSAVRALACREYLASHGRLPGSNRTSRLRKKRRKIVAAWFSDRL